MKNHKGCLLFSVVAVLVPAVIAFWCFWVPGQSWSGQPPALVGRETTIPDQLSKHISAIASTPHNDRYYPALNAATAYIDKELTSYGYKPSSQFFKVDGLQFRNIEAMLKSDEAGAPTLVIGAHYDSAGSAPGANDNGSGVAALLVLAERLNARPIGSKLNIRFAFFANEEPPFFQTETMGSLVYAKSLRRQNVEVVGMLSLETMGYFNDKPGSQNYPFPLSLIYPDTGNFIAFVGMPQSRAFLHNSIRAFRKSAKIPSVGGVAPGFVTGIDWSDHWSFAQMGYPAIMVTDTAPFRYPYYHERNDVPANVNSAKLARVELGLEAMIRDWMQRGAD